MTKGDIYTYKEMLKIRIERDRYKEALEQIANEDYRGNRPWSSVVAYKALNPVITDTIDL